MAKNDNKNENKVKKHFFKDFKAELKKVIWPTPKQLVNNTSAVVVIVLITGIIVFALDAVFDLGNKYGITKLQSIVNDKYNSTESTDSTTESTDDTTENTDSSTESIENTDSTDEGSETENQSSETENTDGTSSTEESSSDNEGTDAE